VGGACQASISRRTQQILDLIQKVQLNSTYSRLQSDTYYIISFSFLIGGHDASGHSPRCAMDTSCLPSLCRFSSSSRASRCGRCCRCPRLGPAGQRSWRRCCPGFTPGAVARRGVHAASDPPLTSGTVLRRGPPVGGCPASNPRPSGPQTLSDRQRTGHRRAPPRGLAYEMSRVVRGVRLRTQTAGHAHCPGVPPRGGRRGVPAPAAAQGGRGCTETTAGAWASGAPAAAPVLLPVYPCPCRCTRASAAAPRRPPRV